MDPDLDLPRARDEAAYVLGTFACRPVLDAILGATGVSYIVEVLASFASARCAPPRVLESLVDLEEGRSRAERSLGTPAHLFGTDRSLAVTSSRFATFLLDGAFAQDVSVALGTYGVLPFRSGYSSKYPWEDFGVDRGDVEGLTLAGKDPSAW